MTTEILIRIKHDIAEPGFNGRVNRYFKRALEIQIFKAYRKSV